MRGFQQFAIALAALPVASATVAQDAGTGYVKPMSRGELVAIAADCAACHADPAGGSDFSGGYAFETPMGKVYVRNITPDPETGIGGWTLEDFDRALRKGKSKTLGHLYPAMPYTSYRYMTDSDVKALYTYLTEEVEPVRNKVSETDLGFPFLRPAMIVWDALFADSNKPPQIENASEQVQRGQYLVDVLGHCGECHTPRGLMFQSKAASEHLAGAVVGGWYAPNISSDKSGVGRWSDDQLKMFLDHGKVRDADAGGDMGLAVQMSLSKLPASDLDAIVAYLKATPPEAGQSLAPVVEKPAPLDIAAVEPVQSYTKYEEFFDTSSTDGAALYVSACATCHGIDGSLPSGAGPMLTQNGAIRAANPINVVQVIANGINLGERDPLHLMPSFRAEFSDAQIAAVASYVRQRFGGIDAPVTEADATAILDGTYDVPWLMLNARRLAWIGLAAAAAIVVAAGTIMAWRRSHRKRYV